MDSIAYNQREKQLALREKLVEIKELRKAGISDIPAHTASQNLRALLEEDSYGELDQKRGHH